MADPLPAALGAANLAHPETRCVRVDLAGRSYDILIGQDIIGQLGPQLRTVLKARACLIVTDQTVAPLYLDRTKAALEGFDVHTLILPQGEKTKAWGFLEQVVEATLAARLERRDCLVALGGGVIGDLVGFAAAITRRGMPFVQVPTSLLAQVDSSVGGKTGINSPLGKNLVGAFHQPALVVADTHILDTLSHRHLRAGYAETVKYGLINQPDFFAWLEAGAFKGVIGGGAERAQAIATACTAKAAIVARDETETGDRALLNLGHTFGHALEAYVDYDSERLVHGEGVAIGMAQAFRFSAYLGLCPPAQVERVEAHLRAAGLPTRLAQLPGPMPDVETLVAAIRQDKKVSGGALTFILARGIGQSFIAKGIEEAPLRAFLAAELSQTV